MLGPTSNRCFFTHAAPTTRGCSTTRFFSAFLCAIGLGCLTAGAAPVVSPAKKLIEYGWDVPTPARGTLVLLPRAHSHNDYEHKRPLLDALDNGFCSIEADVFLTNDLLLVAHTLSRTAPEKTLQTLYLDPLLERTRKNQGRVYAGGPTCWLFIDLKTEAETTYAAVDRVLRGYAEMLTRFEGSEVKPNAITVVITGNRPRETIAGQSVRYAAYDGLIADLASNTAVNLVPVVSEQWSQFFKWRDKAPISPEELALLKNYVDKAHAQGRLIRWWGAPDRPSAWKLFYDAGVDLINTDNHAGLRAFLLEQMNSTPTR